MHLGEPWSLPKQAPGRASGAGLPTQEDFLNAVSAPPRPQHTHADKARTRPPLGYSVPRYLLGSRLSHASESTCALCVAAKPSRGAVFLNPRSLRASEPTCAETCFPNPKT